MQTINKNINRCPFRLSSGFAEYEKDRKNLTGRLSDNLFFTNKVVRSLTGVSGSLAWILMGLARILVGLAESLVGLARILVGLARIPMGLARIPVGLARIPVGLARILVGLARILVGLPGSFVGLDIIFMGLAENRVSVDIIFSCYYKAARGPPRKGFGGNLSKMYRDLCRCKRSE